MKKRKPVTHRRRRSAIAFNNTLQNEGRSTAEQSVYFEFGRRLQALMIKKGWNQSDLAREATKHMPKTGPNQKQGKAFIRDRISHYVRGVRMPRPEGLAALAAALGVKPEDLIPTQGVPYAGKPPPAPTFEMRSEGQGRVMVRINRTMSMETATKISALLTEEDRGSA